MNTIEIPINEYKNLIDEMALLKNSDLLLQLNKLIDLLYQDKYGLFLGEYTEDLIEYSVNQHWNNKENVWDAV